MKKLLIICLMLVCALGLTACGQEKQEQAAAMAEQSLKTVYLKIAV